MNIVDIVFSNAERRPDHPALEQGARIVTYRALRAGVLDLACRLLAAGVGQGDLVAVALPDGIDYPVAMLAVFRIGAVMLPMDVRWTVSEKNHVLRFFAADAVLVDRDTPGLDGARLLIVADLPPPAPPPASWPRDSAAPLLLSLSSGTTGIPKGPRLTHGQFLMRQMPEWISVGFSSADRFLCATPFYFGGGRNFTLSFLMGGGTIVVFPPPYAPDALIDEIARARVTLTFLVPTLLRRVLDIAASPDFDRRDSFATLRLLISSGSALHPQERAAIRESIAPNFVNLYASTEGGCISMLQSDAADAKSGSVGRPVLLCRFDIRDDAGAVLPQGETGHIRQEAPWLPDGFFRNPDETAKSFRDGGYYPGDMGYVDADGYLFITGRAKDMIIRGGVNIYPNEIERVLLAHPAIAEAAVVGWPSPEYGEEIAAFVTCRAAVEEAELRAHCRAELASYKVPRGFFVVAEIPKNRGGKILKADLARMLPAI
jgi:acyl-CoA synthetase (AMP-forming)/AMP-acid ligase II